MSVNSRKKRCVITGSIASGKTTLVEALKRMHDVWVADEEATSLIREQITTGGNIFPWTNPIEFSKTVTSNAVSTFTKAPISSSHCIFDRGVPDSIAFLRIDGLEPTEELLYLSRTYLYDVVLWAPPWQEIFKNSIERPQTWEYAKQIGILLKDVYSSIGYNPIELPKLAVQDRVDFVLKLLSEQ